MRCTTCGEYIYKGKKFNARKEDVENETYLGIRIYRFYIKVKMNFDKMHLPNESNNHQRHFSFMFGIVYKMSWGNILQNRSTEHGLRH